MSRLVRLFRYGASTLIFLLAAICVALPTDSSAQTVTGTLYGLVVDAEGLPLPGVTVTVASPQLIGGAQTRVTGERGEYRLPALPPGVYSVQFELAGFRTARREEIALGAGTTSAIDMTMQVGTIEENVTVIGESPIVDVQSSQLRETAGAAVIENIPTGRAFTDLFNLVPGVVNGGYSDATTGTNSVHGSSIRANLFSIDGASANDPLVPYPTTDINLEMIEEVQVTTGGMSAEFGSASGAVFNIITKSGSNQLAGQVSSYFRNKSFNSNNIDDELRAAGVFFGTSIQEALDAGASIGGPIRQDRLWYFGNYHRLDETYRLIGYPEPVTAEQNTYFVKGTAQISRRDRIDAFYQRRLRPDFPFQPSVNQLDPKVYRLHEQSNHTVNVKWTSTLTDKTFVEARGSVADQQRFTSFPNASPDAPAYQDRSTQQIWGGWYRELARPGNRNSRQVKGDLTHFLTGSRTGTHELKMGGAYDWLINTELREWMAGARLHQLFNGAPNRIVLSNAPVTQNGNVNQWDLYIQDQWNVNSRLTLQLGVRFESVEGWFPEGSVGGVNFPVESFPAQRDVVTFRYAAPRLGFAYDPAGNRKTVFKGNYGKFYNQLYTGEFSGARPYTFGNQTYNWTDRNGDLVWQPGEEGALLSDNRVPGLGSIDPALDASYVTAWILGVERELSQGMAVSAQFIRKDEYDMAETLDTAAPFDSAYAHATVINPIDGAPMTIYPLLRSFQGVPSVRQYTNPGPWTCSFCPELERKYRGVELSFKRRLSDGWQFFGSYVYGRSEGNKGTGHGGNTVFANPNNFIRTGGLTYDIPHQVKLFGTYELPYGVLASVSYTGLAGTPWARTAQFTSRDTPLIVVETAIEVPVEEVGDQRFDWTHEVSLRTEKRFALGSRRHVGLVFDVFNLLNRNTVTAIQNTRIDHANFNKPATIMLPRTIRLGARLNF